MVKKKILTDWERDQIVKQCLLNKDGGKGKTTVPRKFIRYSICKMMGWDYYTYRNQPAPFIDELLAINNLEASVANSKPEIKTF